MDTERWRWSRSSRWRSRWRRLLKGLCEVAVRKDEVMEGELEVKME